MSRYRQRRVDGNAYRIGGIDAGPRRDVDVAWIIEPRADRS